MEPWEEQEADDKIRGTMGSDDHAPATRAHVRGVSMRLRELEHELGEYHAEMESYTRAHDRILQTVMPWITSSFAWMSATLCYLSMRHIFGLEEGWAFAVAAAWLGFSVYNTSRRIVTASKRERPSPWWWGRRNIG